MELTLSREDLKSDRVAVPCSQTKYDDFNEKAQSAINIVKRAKFVDMGGNNYNVILPPSPPEKPTTI